MGLIHVHECLLVTGSFEDSEVQVIVQEFLFVLFLQQLNEFTHICHHLTQSP